MKAMKKLLLLFVGMLYIATTYAQYSPNQDPGFERTFYPTVGDSLHAPYNLKAVTRMAVDSTYFHIHHFRAGQTVPIALASTLQFCAYLFYENDPNVVSLSWQSQREIINNHLYEMIVDTVSIAQSGNYVLLIMAKDSVAIGTCYGSIGNSSLTSRIANNYIECSQPSNIELNTFAIGGAQSDVQIFVVQGSNPGTIVAYNDNYAGTGDYNWGKNARIKKTYTTSPSGVIVNLVKKGYLCNRKADVYIGCPTASYTCSYFSNYELDDAIAAAPQTPIGSTPYYNCIAWAGKEWMRWVWPVSLFSEYYSTESPLKCFDNYFESRGLTRTGATADNSVVDLWGISSYTSTTFTHASVKAFCGGTEGYHSIGYAWESKAGRLDRVFHPRDALEGGSYGEILYHYRVAPIELLNPYVPLDSNTVYEHIMFSGPERLYLATQAASIATSIKTDFETYYDAVEDFFETTPISSLSMLEQNSAYQSLISYCVMYPVTESLIFQKLDAGSIVAVKLVESLYINNNMSAYDQMRDYIALNTTNNQGQTIRHPLLSNTTLFAKCVMNSNAIQNLPYGNQQTYSNDENILNVKVNGHHIAIEVLLDHDATVSVDIASVFGDKMMTAMAREKKESGKHHADLYVANEGTYVVCCSIDGRTYTKKISIR